MSDSGFYVGYLPMPRRHKRAVIASVVALVIVMLGVGGWVSASQGGGGEGVWDTGTPVTWEGVLVTEPYPMLMQDDGSVVLIVEASKIGAQERFFGMGGERVELTGWRLERGDRRMIEMEPGDGSVRVLEQNAGTGMVMVMGDEVELPGEILDSKCYMGAMKPGSGKGHKACATLCIDGGIPPMLFGGTLYDSTHEWSVYLIVDEEGGPAGELVREWIGEPVTVRGRVGLIGDMGVISVSRGGIRRSGL